MSQIKSIRSVCIFGRAYKQYIDGLIISVTFSKFLQLFIFPFLVLSHHSANGEFIPGGYQRIKPVYYFYFHQFQLIRDTLVVTIPSLTALCTSNLHPAKNGNSSTQQDGINVWPLSSGHGTSGRRGGAGILGLDPYGLLMRITLRL